MDEQQHQPPAPSGQVAAEALLRVLEAVVRRGRDELGKAAKAGRDRMDVRQLYKDRDAMYRKVGREVRALVEGGEIDHPGIVRGIARIEELEAKIAMVEAGSGTDPSQPVQPADTD